jgi:uncharacterized membrane protein
MKRFNIHAIFALLVAFLFLLPPAVALGSTFEDDTIPEAVIDEPLQEYQDTQSEETADPGDIEIPDPENEARDQSKLVPYGVNIANPEKDGTIGSKGPDMSMEAKSSVMVVSKIGLHDTNEDPVEELDDGEEGKVSAEITNEGGQTDVMTDVEVDFYYVDKDGDIYYIDSANIELIEGGGNSSTAIVDWKADMLARQIKVVADPDGSDGGPTEAYQQVNITQADYAQKLYCPYPTGSGVAGDTLDFNIKVDNIGGESDDVKLEVVGAGTWEVRFDNGQSTKTIYGLGSEEHSWQKVSVTIPLAAGGDDYKDVIIRSTSQEDESKIREFQLTATVLRSSRPILVYDADSGSAEYGTWCDTSKYWEAALDDGGYNGMHYKTASMPADLSGYDLILMNTGYDWTGGITSQEETSLINFLKNGGSLWIGGAMYMQASNEPSYGKTTVHPLYYQYMNVSWQAQNRHPPQPIIGVAGDPVGQGMFYGNNYIFTEGQDWAEAVWPYANDTWSAGTFNFGNQYVGMRHHWQGSTPDKPEEYRAIFTGIDLAQVGDTFEKDENGWYGHPDRTDMMYNSATWLGVSPPLPETNDLGVTAIIDPAGDYIYPGDSMDINVEVSNFGIKDFESSFTLTVDIVATSGGTYSTTLQKNVDASDNRIPARGWAYPGTTVVSLSWTVPNNEDVTYEITATVSSDDNSDNDEFVIEVESKKLEDVKTNGAYWEWRLHYWLTAVKDTPIGIDVEIENVGSREMTFTAYVDIVDPWESGILETLTKEVTLGAGHVRSYHFIWTPDKAAGCRDATQSWRVNYATDGPPYWLDVGVDIEDDDPGNDKVSHTVGSYGTNVGDITVVDWYESGEQGVHGWDLGEPWHWTPMYTQGGEFGIWHGNKSSVDAGVPRYDDSTKGIMTSPVLDWGQYTAIRTDYLYVQQMQNPDYVSIQIKMADEADYWKDAPNNYGSNYSSNTGNGGYLNNGNNYGDYAGHDTQLRWCFSSDDATNNIGFTFDLFMIMATADNYFDRDVILDDISVDPLVGDIEEDRKIKVTVKNIGEVVPDSSYRIWMNLTDDEGNDQNQYLNPGRNYIDVPQDDEFKKGTTHTEEWDWFPEEYGIYNIETSVEWDQDEFPDNNVLETVGLVQFYFFFDDNENGNPPPRPSSQGGGNYDPWITGTEDTNGKGGNRATDDWEQGMPTEGPAHAYSGEICWGTSMDEYYSNNSKDSSFIQMHIDLRTAKDPYLLFAHWLEIEAQGYDAAYVEIQEVGSDSWTALWQNPEPEKEIWKTNGWKMVNISLVDWQLKDINLRFRLMSDSDVSFPGWYIDDVGVSGITPPGFDARVDTIEVTPFYGGSIPPSESIVIDATVSNIGTRDSGGSNKITVSGKVFKVSGQSENKIADLPSQEVQINSGGRTVVPFNYQLPAGNNIKYRIEITADYGGSEDEKYKGDNTADLTLWGKKLHDAAIDRLYVTPPLEDAGFPRVVTAVVTSHSNIPEGFDNEFFIDFTVKYKGESQKIAEGSVPVRLQVGETQEVRWNWTAYTYGMYDVFAEVDLDEDTNSAPGHENIRMVEVATVEKEFSDTVDNPVVSGGEYYDVFWTDFAGSESASGWHKVDRGYLSRESYYVGRPTFWSYTGSRNDELISEPIDLSEVDGATMRWYTQFHIEGGAYDNMIVYFSDDNGESWNEQVKYPKDNYRNSSQYSESDNGWLMMEEGLENRYYTEDFRIKFRFVSDRAINYLGVFIDDISIYVTSTTKNHAPVSRFTAEWLDEDGEVKETSYSDRLIDRPLPEFDEIRGNPAFQNLPTPDGGKQGGIGFNAEDGLSDTVRFDGSYSYDPDRADDSITYSWDFGDGSTDNGMIVEHQYSDIPLDKFYLVTLTVKDESGDITEDLLFVWLGNSPPEVKFIITDSFDTSHVLNDDYNADVFYGDQLKLISQVTDPENDHIISYEWEFAEQGKAAMTFASTDVVDFTAGLQHLFRDKDGDDPVMPPYNSNPVTYTIMLTAMDNNFNAASYTLNVTVFPYAMEEFITPVKLGETLLDAKVNLVWRGLPDEAAPDRTRISPDHPVYVYIEPTDSPDPNLGSSGGIGLVYDIRAVGCRLQNGDDGFINAEISLPILTADLEEIGDSFSLQDGLRLEYYNEIEKRFYPVDDSHVMADGGVKYVVGEVEHFSIYTAIVHPIYVRDPEVQPDLSVFKIEFSRSPAQNGQEVEVRATIKNTGKITARNVDVKIYDGDDLIGDQRIDAVGASGGSVVISETFTVAMLNIESSSENHYIKVFVNKQHAINEGSANYKNNEASQLLVVTTVQTTSPSFESTSFMMVISVLMVVGASMVVMSKGTRKKDEE